jgi:hypothetical protein
MMIAIIIIKKGNNGINDTDNIHKSGKGKRLDGADILQGGSRVDSLPPGVVLCMKNELKLLEMSIDEADDDGEDRHKSTPALSSKASSYTDVYMSKGISGISLDTYNERKEYKSVSEKSPNLSKMSSMNMDFYEGRSVRIIGGGHVDKEGIIVGVRDSKGKGDMNMYMYVCMYYSVWSIKWM